MLPPLFQDDATRRAFCSALATRALGRRIVYLEETTSTSDVARDTDLAPGTLVLAEAQTAGRGRREGAWRAPPRAGLLLSAVLEAPATRSLLPLGTSAAAAALCRAAARCGATLSVKWPNDLVAGNRKAAGVMIEAPASRERVILGAGVNVLGTPDDYGVRDRPLATLSELAGRDVDRKQLLGAFLVALEPLWDLLLAGRTEEVAAAVRAHLLTGERVRIQAGSGRVHDVDDLGRLVVALDGGGLAATTGPVVWSDQ